MRIAIYGAGSLGIVLGAYLSRAGIEADLVNRNEAQVRALRENGARVEGGAPFSAPVKALLPTEMQGEYELILLMTKQRDNPETARFLLPYLGEEGMLCTMQNGLPEPGLAQALGADRVLGCTVEWGATLEGPGVSRLTSSPDSLSFGLGALTPAGAGKLPAVKALLETMCPVKVEEDFLGVRWSKLLINASFSGMSAVLGATFGEAAADKRSRRYIQRIIKECIDVARARGVRIAPVQGKDIVKLLDYKGPVKKALSSLIIPIAIKKHRHLKASMLQDLEKGKPTEVDAINGVVSAQGREAGVPTPVNDRVAEIIHGIERGEYSPGFHNLALLEP